MINEIEKKNSHNRSLEGYSINDVLNSNIIWRSRAVSVFKKVDIGGQIVLLIENQLYWNLLQDNI